MNRPVRRSRLGLRPLVILGALALSLTIVVSFIGYLGDRIAYEGLTPRPVGVAPISTCIAIGLLPSAWLRLTLARPSDAILWMLYVISVIPASVMIPLSPPLSPARSILFVALVVLSFGLLSLVQRAPAVPLPWSDRLAAVSWPLMLAIGALALTAVIARFGISLQLLSLANVYDTRLAFRSTAAGAGPLFAYLIVWIQNVFGPLLFMGGLVRRSALGVALGLLSEFWVYQTLGNRQALVAIAICYLVWRLGRRHFERGPGLMLWGSALLATSTVLVDIRRGSFLSGYFLVRVLMLPAVLMADYFGYFSNHPPVILRDGLLSVLAKSPYRTATAHTIGFEFFHNPNTSANGNIWADGFANFGFVGIFLTPLVLALLLWLLDNGTHRAAPGVVGAVLAVTVISLANGGLQTILVTNGFAPLIAALVLTGGGIVAPRDGRWLPFLRRPLRTRQIASSGHARTRTRTA